MAFFNRVLYDLNLLRNSRELNFKESVKLVKTAPCATLDKTDENTAHRLVIEAFVTIENQYLTAEVLTERFNRLSFACTCRTVRVASITKLHSHDERQEALV